jgi:hypothetical protein
MKTEKVTIDIENMEYGSPLTSLFANSQSLSEKQNTVIDTITILTEVFSNYYSGPNFNRKSEDDKEAVTHMNRAFMRFLELIAKDLIDESLNLESIQVPLEYSELAFESVSLIESNELLHDIFDYYFESDASEGSDYMKYSEVKWFLYTTMKLSFAVL